MIETFNFLSSLPNRILSIKAGDKFEAWYFDGINQVGERATGATREEAIKNLQK